MLRLNRKEAYKIICTSRILFWVEFNLCKSLEFSANFFFIGPITDSELILTKLCNNLSGFYYLICGLLFLGEKVIPFTLLCNGSWHVGKKMEEADEEI